MKEKAARFPLKQDKKKDFSKIMVQINTIKEQMKTASNRHATQELNFFSSDEGSTFGHWS